MGISARMMPDVFSENGKTYHEHLVSVHASERSNYEIRCSCGHLGFVASVSDVFAANCALDHVKEMQPESGYQEAVRSAVTEYHARKDFEQDFSEKMILLNRGLHPCKKVADDQHYFSVVTGICHACGALEK